MEEKRMILDVNESPKRVGEWFILALQHVLAMFVACITVPLIVYSPYAASNGQPLSQVMIAPTLVSAGVGTLIYIFLTKMKSPVFLASSFAYIAPMSSALAIGANGTTPNFWALPIGMAMVGGVYVVISLIIRFFGVEWLNKLLPPIVVGPIIMVIGLSLATSAISNLSSGLLNDGSQGYNLMSILTGLVAMLATALFAHYCKGTLSLIPFVMGMLAGYVFGIIVTAIGYYGFKNSYFRVIDFTPLVNNFSNISIQSFLDYPHFVFVNPNTVEFNASMLGQISLLFIPVAFVTICEHIGDHKNLSGILGRDLLVDPGLSRSLAGDGIATAVSGIFSGVANTTYGENVAVVGVTKIASVKVIILASIMAIVLGFFKPAMALIQTIPACITGGISLILYGFIASSGVKLLISEKIDMGKTKNIFVASVILVAGIGGLAINYDKVSITPIAVSMILGIIMNFVLKDKKEEPKKEIGETDQVQE